MDQPNNNSGASGIAIAALIIAIIALILILAVLGGLFFAVERDISLQSIIYNTVNGTTTGQNDTFTTSGNSIYQVNTSATMLTLNLNKPSGTVTGTTFLINNTGSSSNGTNPTVNVTSDNNFTVIDNVGNQQVSPGTTAEYYFRDETTAIRLS